LKDRKNIFIETWPLVPSLSWRDEAGNRHDN